MAGCPFSASRRVVLGGALAGAGVAAAAAHRAIAAGPPSEPAPPVGAGSADAVPFHGPHQAGIATPQQSSVVFASFDLVGNDGGAVQRLLAAWTEAAARLSAGLPVADAGVGTDDGEVAGLPPRRLTLTFGFGPGLFSGRNGEDRFGLRARRPAPLVDLPTFNGDQVEDRFSGGDLLVQACADDQSVAFHAVRQLARLAAGNDAGSGYGGKRAGSTAFAGGVPPVATIRWMQAGFLPGSPAGETPRNLLGFKDGTQNPGVPHDAERSGGKLIGNGGLAEHVWVDHDRDGGWMRNGTYLVFRRIRLSLEHWDRTPVDFQEEVIGRRRASGAPLTGGDEFAVLDLDAVDGDGNPVIADGAHVRVGSASANQGARLLRRSFAYQDGLSMVAERWPPWRQGLEYDAGLLFAGYGADPRQGFVPIFGRMSKLDMLNQFATHTGSAIFALPGGLAPGATLGDGLFATA